MDIKSDEKKDFVLMHNGWFIRHFTICNGFMIMDRYSDLL